MSVWKNIILMIKNIFVLGSKQQIAEKDENRNNIFNIDDA